MCMVPAFILTVMAIPDDRWAVSGEPVREYRPPEMEDSGGGETQVWTQIYINFIFSIVIDSQ